MVYNHEITNHLKTIGINTILAPVKSRLSNKADNRIFDKGLNDGKNFNLSRQMTSNAKMLN